MPENKPAEAVMLSRLDPVDRERVAEKLCTIQSRCDEIARNYEHVDRTSKEYETTAPLRFLRLSTLRGDLQDRVLYAAGKVESLAVESLTEAREVCNFIDHAYGGPGIFRVNTGRTATRAAFEGEPLDGEAFNLNPPVSEEEVTRRQEAIKRVYEANVRTGDPMFGALDSLILLEMTKFVENGAGKNFAPNIGINHEFKWPIDVIRADIKSVGPEVFKALGGPFHSAEGRPFQKLTDSINTITQNLGCAEDQDPEDVWPRPLQMRVPAVAAERLDPFGLRSNRTPAVTSADEPVFDTVREGLIGQ